VIVSKKFSFDAAHFLPGYKGKCSKLHGHRWICELACRGYVAEDTGMVIDFAELKKFCDIFEDRFDHTCLNDLPGLSNPTAENICQYIYDEFNMWCVAHGVRCEYIRIWETPNSMCELHMKEVGNALLS